MAYQGVYFMLYPNYFNQTSFATNWLEAGEHIKEVPLDGDGDTKEKGESEPIPAAKPKVRHPKPSLRLLSSHSRVPCSVFRVPCDDSYVCFEDFRVHFSVCIFVS